MVALYSPSILSCLLSSINGNPVTAVPFLFELISQKVIDINATDVTAAFSNDANIRKDNDMQIAHVQTYVIAQEHQLLFAVPRMSFLCHDQAF